MKNFDIKLNMDMSNVSFGKGEFEALSSGSDEDYITKINIVLPTQSYRFPVGTYIDTYENQRVEIRISLITQKEDDPVYKLTKDFNFGADGSGLEFIPFEAFTDNRGEYPALVLTIIFFKRMASWIDQSHVSGMKMDFDYEKMQITGARDNEEKIKAILMINRLITSQKWDGINNLRYDDVTVFVESYYEKASTTLLLLKVNALTSKKAYKTAVYNYILPNIEKSETPQALAKFKESYSEKDIASEQDLLITISEAINNILKYQIESRRWVEPFWDGQRKIQHEGNELIIPRTPKRETKIQPTLHVILDMALSPLGIHVIRESDEGVGALDFKFLYTTKNGTPLSIGLEFKVAHHKKIKKGICHQLPAYLEAIRSLSGIFVVMWFKDGKYFKDPKVYEKASMETWLLEQADIVSKKKNINLSTIMLDASVRPSASSL